MEYKKHFLQKVAQVIGIICIIVSLGCGIYLLTLLGNENKILKGSIGATTFFFFTVGIVLHTISGANLPKLKIDSDDGL